MHWLDADCIGNWSDFTVEKIAHSSSVVNTLVGGVLHLDSFYICTGRKSSRYGRCYILCVEFRPGCTNFDHINQI